VRGPALKGSSEATRFSEIAHVDRRPKHFSIRIALQAAAKADSSARRFDHLSLGRF
jgi:hypothetical protein